MARIKLGSISDETSGAKKRGLGAAGTVAAVGLALGASAVAASTPNDTKVDSGKKSVEIDGSEFLIAGVRA